VGREGLERTQSAATTLISPLFDLCLDRNESPRRAAVMWLGTQQPPAALEELVQGLRSSNLGVRQDQAFRPHLTLVRDPLHRLEPSTIEPVHWPARDFVLASSVLGPNGSEYTVLGRWLLRPQV
jgi:2'-5' RNA ligase